MIGLIKKDVLALRKVLVGYGLILGVMLALVMFIPHSLQFFPSFIPVLAPMLPVSAFAYDEQAGWDGYAAALPLSRRAVVGARYLFTLLVAACAVVLGAAGCVFPCAVEEGYLRSRGMGSILDYMPLDPMKSVGWLFVCLGVALLVLDVTLPLSYKLGSERARSWVNSVVFLLIALLFAAWRLGLVDLGFLEELTSAGSAALVTLAALAGMGVSFLISCRIVEQKEF